MNARQCSQPSCPSASAAPVRAECARRESIGARSVNPHALNAAPRLFSSGKRQGSQRVAKVVTAGEDGTVPRRKERTARLQRRPGDSGE